MRENHGTLFYFAPDMFFELSFEVFRAFKRSSAPLYDTIKEIYDHKEELAFFN
jgi:hypothetical protein